MKPYSLSIDADNGAVTTPLVRAILGTLLQIKATFTEGGETIQLAEGTTGRLVVKPEGALDGDPGMFDSTWTYSTGTYLLAAVADSPLLRTTLGNKATVTLMAQIEWQLPDEGEPRKCFPFVLEMVNSVSRPGDNAPNPISDSTWEWIQETIQQGDNVTFTIDEEARTITINSATAAHTHGISEITGLQAALDGKAAASHTQAISTVTGLQAALDGKAPLSHTHAIADTTGLQAALDGKAAASHTQAISTVTGLQAALDDKAPLSHTHAIADTTGLQAALDGKTVLHRVAGLLQGYTSTAPATAPQIQISFGSWVGGSGGDISFLFDSTPVTVVVDTVDPGDGKPWVDITSVSSGEALAIAMGAALLAGYGPSGTEGSLVSNVDVTSGVLTITGIATGATASIQLDSIRGLDGVLTGAEFPLPPVYGADAGPPSGETDEVVIFTAPEGRRFFLSHAWMKASSTATIQIGIYHLGSFTLLAERAPPSSGGPSQVLPNSNDELDAWWTVSPVGASLMIKFNGVPNTSDTFPVLAEVLETA